MDQKIKYLLVFLVVAVVGLLAAVVFLLADNNSSSESDDLDSSTEEISDEEEGTEDDAVVDEDEVETRVAVYLFDMEKFNTPDNIDYVTAVNRTTTRRDVATFAVEQIIAGPTLAEQADDLQPTFGEGLSVWFEGESNCSGNDFTISIEDGDATVQFCRVTMLAGDMSGFIIEQQIQNSLKQFSTVDRVRILNSNGACFNDMRGVGPEECFE